MGIFRVLTFPPTATLFNSPITSHMASGTGPNHRIIILLLTLSFFSGLWLKQLAQWLKQFAQPLQVCWVWAGPHSRASPGLSTGRNKPSTTQTSRKNKNSSECFISVPLPSNCPISAPASRSETTQCIHKALRTFFLHFKKKSCNSFSKGKDHSAINLDLLLKHPQRAQGSFTQKHLLRHNLKWNLFQTSNWKLRFSTDCLNMDF